LAVQKRNHKLHETERNLRIFKATSHEPIALKLGQLQVELTGVILPFATCTDPWSILYEPCPDVKQLSPGSSLRWTCDQLQASSDKPKNNA